MTQINITNSWIIAVSYWTKYWYALLEYYSCVRTCKSDYEIDEDKMRGKSCIVLTGFPGESIGFISCKKLLGKELAALCQLIVTEVAY